MGGNASKKQNYSELFILHNAQNCIFEVQYVRTINELNVKSPPMTFYIYPKTSKRIPIDIRDINELTILYNHIIIVHISNINRLKGFNITS